VALDIKRTAIEYDRVIGCDAGTGLATSQRVTLAASEVQPYANHIVYLKFPVNDALNP